MLVLLVYLTIVKKTNISRIILKVLFYAGQ